MFREGKVEKDVLSLLNISKEILFLFAGREMKRLDYKPMGCPLNAATVLFSLSKVIKTRFYEAKRSPFGFPLF